MLTSAEFLVLFLTIASFAPVGLAIVILKNPNLVAKGQDAAGKGMAVGCSVILLLSLAALIAVADVIVGARSWEGLGLAWRVVSVVPAAIGILAVIVSFVISKVARERRIRERYEAEMLVPAALIVDHDDGRFSALYNAISPHFKGLEISLRHPGALLWQQREWFPRLRLLMMSAEALSVTEGDVGEMARDLLRDMARSEPVCPIVLHAPTQAVADAISQRLPAWRITTILMDDPHWIASRWVGIAREMLETELKARPAPPSQD